jgi:hypothetical protein
MKSNVEPSDAALKSSLCVLDLHVCMCTQSVTEK